MSNSCTRDTHDDLSLQAGTYLHKGWGFASLDDPFRQNTLQSNPGISMCYSRKSEYSTTSFIVLYEFEITDELSVGRWIAILGHVSRRLCRSPSKGLSPCGGVVADRRSVIRYYDGEET